MESKKNQIIDLEGSSSYIILEHAIYKGENYYLGARLSEDKKEITDDMTYIHEINKEDGVYFETVTDFDLIKKLTKYMDQ
ncbi:MAG: hypothetical protein PHU94_04470 [Bacilli bacterium]|nr:hypothetical protein [Bacilli bacterium]MDD4733598.1 hypothetical protein [Bacilli bacterium]